jgi:hypothetical protein
MECFVFFLFSALLRFFFVSKLTHDPNLKNINKTHSTLLFSSLSLSLFFFLTGKHFQKQEGKADKNDCFYTFLFLFIYKEIKNRYIYIKFRHA